MDTCRSHVRNFNGSPSKIEGLLILNVAGAGCAMILAGTGGGGGGGPGGGGDPVGSGAPEGGSGCEEDGGGDCGGDEDRLGAVGWDVDAT